MKLLVLPDIFQPVQPENAYEHTIEGRLESEQTLKSKRSIRERKEVSM